MPYQLQGELNNTTLSIRRETKEKLLKVLERTGLYMQFDSMDDFIQWVIKQIEEMYEDEEQTVHKKEGR